MKGPLPLISSVGLSLVSHLGFIAISLLLTIKDSDFIAHTTKSAHSRHFNDASEMEVFLPLVSSHAKQRSRLTSRQRKRAESPPASEQMLSGAGTTADVWMIGPPRPEYPEISRRREEEGRVTVSVLIGKDGTATEVTLSGSSGYSRLDEATVNFFRKAKFGFRYPIPTPLQKNFSVLFKLDSAELADQRPLRSGVF